MSHRRGVVETIKAKCHTGRALGSQRGQKSDAYILFEFEVQFLTLHKRHFCRDSTFLPSNVLSVTLI